MARKTGPVVPLGRDASSRLLPWVFTLMVYLASLSLASVLMLHGAADRWDRGEINAVTVQLLPLDDGSEADRIAQTLKLLRSTPGIAAARVLEISENMALLEPWLGEGDVLGELPLPRLIDVTLTPGETLDVEALSKTLAEAVPGVTVDDPKVWLNRLATLGRSLEAVAGAIVVLIASAAVATVIFITRMGLAVHQDIIELLHLIGARDSYVAYQFQNHALSVGLRGGLLGIAMAVGTLIGIRSAAERLDAPLLPDLSIEPWAWAAFAMVPLVTALIAMVTARITALRVLSRMP